MEEKDRYTNRNGLQFYISKKDIFEMSDRDSYRLTIIASPKNFSQNNVKFQFNIIISDQFLIDNRLSSTDNFISEYGYYEFLKWLNEINELKSISEEINIFSGNEELSQKISDGGLLVNEEDDDRLQKIAEEIILKTFYNNRSDKIFSDEDLKERCFVPNYIFNHTYNLLKRQDFLDLENFQLTLKVISYYKNTNKFDLPQSRFSRTVFVAQSLVLI